MVDDKHFGWNESCRDQSSMRTYIEEITLWYTCSCIWYVSACQAMVARHEMSFTAGYWQKLFQLTEEPFFFCLNCLDSSMHLKEHDDVILLTKRPFRKWIVDNLIDHISFVEKGDGVILNRKCEWDRVKREMEGGGGEKEWKSERKTDRQMEGKHNSFLG